MPQTTLTIEQIRSPIRRRWNQRQTLLGLGLNRIGRRVRLLDTPEIRGMVAKVKHLVRIISPVPGDIKELSRLRFDALAGYIRDPRTVVMFEELEWYATIDERLLGMVVRDCTDDDFGWIILGRDERLRFRAITANASLESPAHARADLLIKLKERHAQPDEGYHQGDAPEPAMDFLTPLGDAASRNPHFRTLTEDARFSPARGVVEAMMRYYEDADGNFVEQFQTAAFDARLWELYLFAVFTELGYANANERNAPDFIFTGPMGSFGLEATSSNPPQGGEPRSLPKGKEELNKYIENYVPIKLGRALRRKLERDPPYWQEPGMEDLPFVIAVQDFHLPRAMTMIVPAVTEYVFGVRHTMRDGVIHISEIGEHMWGKARELSGFFTFDNAEHVSAVIVNPQGTLPKFNRMGFCAEFGDRRVRMTRTGIRRGELDPDNPMPKPFHQIVHAADYSETWVEGMVVLHNPFALRPLHPGLIPGAAHEFLQPDGSIISHLPAFHPVWSMTEIIPPR